MHRHARGPGRGTTAAKELWWRWWRVVTLELIIRGGYNVYPREVEDAIYTHPAVAEAAVVGIPDARMGQEVMAYVALRPGRHATEAEIIEHVRERIASYKYPRSVEFRDVLPKNPANKILKREL
jgi:long-chain acyl-CoA synthetase